MVLSRCFAPNAVVPASLGLSSHRTIAPIDTRWRIVMPPPSPTIRANLRSRPVRCATGPPKPVIFGRGNGPHHFGVAGLGFDSGLGETGSSGAGAGAVGVGSATGGGITAGAGTGNTSPDTAGVVVVSLAGISAVPSYSRPGDGSAIRWTASMKIAPDIAGS